MKLWILNDYNYKKYIFFRELLDQFSKEYNIKVDLEIKTGKNLWYSIFNFFEQPQEKIADVIEIPHQWTSLLTKLGLLLPVDLIYDEIEEVSLKFFPFLKESMVFESSKRVYSIPLYFEILAMYYKKNMLRSIVSPSEMKDIKWQDLFVLCEKLLHRYRKKDYYPIENTNVNGYINSDDMLCCVANRSEGYFSNDKTTLNLHKDEVFDGIKEYLSLAQKRYLVLFEENFYDIGFVKKNLSSIVFSFRRDFMEMDDVEVVRFPDIMRSYEAGRSFNLSFFSGTDEIDEVKKFVKWFYGEKEILIKLSKTLKTFSPFKNQAQEVISRKEYVFFESLFDKVKMIPNIVVYPSFQFMIDDVLMKNCIKIVNGGYNPDELKKNLLEIKAVTEYLISSY